MFDCLSMYYFACKASVSLEGALKAVGEVDELAEVMVVEEPLYDELVFGLISVYDRRETTYPQWKSFVLASSSLLRESSSCP